MPEWASRGCDFQCEVWWLSLTLQYSCMINNIYTSTTHYRSGEPHNALNYTSQGCWLHFLHVNSSCHNTANCNILLYAIYWYRYVEVYWIVLHYVVLQYCYILIYRVAAPMSTSREHQPYSIEMLAVYRIKCVLMLVRCFMQCTASVDIPHTTTTTQLLQTREIP